MKYSLIVAGTKIGGIGNKGTLPWPKLQKDLKFFKDLSLQSKNLPKKNVVLMGRRTWESIPLKFRPLSDRINVIITSNLNLKVPNGVHIVENFDKANELCQSLDEADQGFIIGGASVYKEAMEKNLVDTIYYTKVHKEFECDVFFPMDLLKHYNLKDKDVPIVNDNGIPIQFLQYKSK